MFSLPIRRPVATSMVFLGVVLLGLIGWLRLPVELVPALGGDQLFVQFFRPGSEPEVVERETRVASRSRPTPAASSQISARDKKIYCNLLYVQDAQLVDDSEAYYVVGEMHSMSADKVRSIVVSVAMKLNEQGNYDIDAFCYGR